VLTWLVGGVERGDEMDSAIAGLLGAVIGGAITATTSIGIEAGRGWAQARKERHARLATVRTAARLLDLELKTVEALMLTCLENKRSNVSANLDMQAWQRYATELASDLSYEAWVPLTRGVAAVERVVTLAPREGRPLTEGEVAAYKHLVVVISAAREALRDYLETGER
jgi:hypothetical protein